MEGKIKYRFEHIDASRFWAFLSIFILHAYTVPTFNSHPGLKSFITKHIAVFQLGVDYFFVLSGFLISWTLLKKADFSLRKFYLKRMLRIWPLYFLIVVLVYLVHYFTGQLNTLPPLRQFVFTLNFYLADNGIMFLPFAAILWSIAIEEQFYIFWGLCMKYFKKYFNEISISLILLSILFRALTNENQALYFSSFSYLGNFAVGALVAKWIMNDNFKNKIRNIPWWFISTIYFTLFINVLFYSYWYNGGIMLVFEKFIFSLLFAFIILEQSYASQSIFKLGNSKKLTHLGIISYGLYCFHTIILTLFTKIAAHFELTGIMELLILNPIAILTVTILAANFSYVFYEKRFLLLKEKLND